MPHEWNPAKRIANLAKHGVDFAVIEAFEWATALVRADVRFDYGEVRLVALGLIGSRLHALVYTVERRVVWIISLRKANNTEKRLYVEAHTP